MASVQSKEGPHHECDFGDGPMLEIETGHPIVPNVEIWQCSACGHGVTRPAMDDVSQLYANRASEDYLARDGRLVRALKMLVFRRLAKFLLAFAPKSVRNVADYGTGSGMLASALAREAPPKITVYAFDFFDDPPGQMPGVQYRSFGRSKQWVGQIDMLTCFHVLEHSEDSDVMLAELRSYLRPGGTLVVEVPNIDCVWTPWFGKSCGNWYVPYHRVHFSRQSLRRLIESHELEIVAEQDVCGPTFATSLATLLGVKPNSMFLFAALMLRPIQWAVEKTTHRPSALRIVARKLQ